MYDRACNHCGHQALDCYEPIAADTPKCSQCELGRMERVWLARASGVIGDEIDITVENGMCNPDGSPRRFTSRTELRREEVRRGWTNHVVHQGTKGGDKSPHTSRWV